MLLENIMQAVGNTPTVRLNKIANELECEMYGKCEFFNPGGSVKDRIGFHMVLEAEKAGVIKRGYTLIEPTSGNTGVGIALAGAVLGYNVIIVMPEKMSHEKQIVIESLGAKIIRTPTEAASDDPESHLSVAKRLNEEMENSYILDQYANPHNPEIHYWTTAREILDDAGDSLAMVVMSVGTGGTISGVAKRIKQEKPDVKIVGVDPYGSILGGGEEVYPYEVEGIGYDFFPGVLNNSLIDEYVKVDDKHSFITAKRLIKEEGLLVGGSSGAAVWGALQAAKSLKKGQRCVVILPDSIRNYLTKFVDDKWMQQQGFI